ncbi:hypothetical protein BD309DRAFT_645609 [Dichomitus squalens]|uniref:Uncharacterized protein n=1 Tax=Dichomitus squalens TaxID=114155 RepID=A0A4Q9NWP4_9APHY|nr:hypothetical protein BD309DRAFT_645609 [Dichomitus squalens]TBU57361.1 hypothetical protein BD310DRAFT_556890 [Dichomitus squalens]
MQVRCWVASLGQQPMESKVTRYSSQDESRSGLHTMHERRARTARASGSCMSIPNYETPAVALTDRTDFGRARRQMARPRCAIYALFRQPLQPTHVRVVNHRLPPSALHQKRSVLSINITSTIHTPVRVGRPYYPRRQSDVREGLCACDSHWWTDNPPCSSHSSRPSCSITM